MNIVYIFLFLIIFIIFLYYGYKDDYKRDKTGFKTILVGIIGSSLIFFALFIIKTEADVLIKHKLHAYYLEQFGWKKDMELFISKADKSQNELEEFLTRTDTLKIKVDYWMSIIDTLFFVLAYWAIGQFNKMVKRYFQARALKGDSV